MNPFRRLSRVISAGLGHNHPLINSLRPAYERILDLANGGRGVLQTLNGHEQFRADPFERRHFPDVYDPAVCDFLRASVQPGAVCLNVGAHVGIYALCFSEWSKPNGRVFAFEPNPETRAILLRHVALNGREAQIEVIPQAVSRAPGEAIFYATATEGFSGLGAPQLEGVTVRAKEIPVSMTSIDAFCRARSLKPDWLTLDIEGFEIDALAGGRQTILDRGSALGIVVEIHPNLWPVESGGRAGMEALLKELGRRAVPMTGQSDALGEYGLVRLEVI